MSRWTAGTVAALMVLLGIAALWSAAPAPATAQTAPDVRLRETAAPTSPTPGEAEVATRLTLRLSSATLEEDERGLTDGADLTLLAQPTYVALPNAGPNLVRISPAVTITLRDSSGRDIGLSSTARLTFDQPGARGGRVYRLDGDAWRAVQAVARGPALVVQPVSPGTYALFAALPPDWSERHDVLPALSLNAARLVLDDLAPNS
jgi:hypothetical protein